MKRIFCFFLFLASLQVSGQTLQNRSEKWARPISSTQLKNLYQIDSNLYRCEQPSAETCQQLRQLGITEVLSLRFWRNNRDEIGTLNMLDLRVPMQAHNIKDAQVAQALRYIVNRKGPLAFHCKHGSDRTGTICAVYRIVIQKWSKQDALDELMNGGYGYHKIFKNIPKYIQNLDVEKMSQLIYQIPIEAKQSDYSMTLNTAY